MRVLEKALDIWLQITGSDPNATRFRFSDWDLRNMNEDLKKSLILDESGATTLMLLEYFMEQYADNKSFTMTEILKDFENLKDYMTLFHELKSLCNDDQISQIKNSMKKELKKSLEQAHLATEDVLKILDDDFALAILRRDALNSINTLALHQFYQGEPGPKPLYLEDVYTCWNVNSLIRLVSKSFDSGICLCMVRDQLSTSSYFAFAIKNGGTLSILTDKPRYSHPMQKFMSRRAGRELENRVMKNHFPYELLDLDIDGRGDLMVKDSTALAVYQTELVPIKKLSELDSRDIVWITMMFALIEEKFFKKNFKTPELSYTGEMVKAEELLDLNISNLPAVQDYKPIIAPRMTVESVNSENTKNDWDSKPIGKNQWLEDRYEHLVSEDILNQIDMDGGKTQKYLLPDSSEIQTWDMVEDQKLGYWDKFEHKVKDKGFLEIQSLDPTNFGTEEKVLADVRWVGRYNKAKVIRREAQAEFELRKKEIINWFTQKVKENKENLIPYIYSPRCLEYTGNIVEFSTSPKEHTNMVTVDAHRDRGSLWLYPDHGDVEIDLDNQAIYKYGRWYSTKLDALSLVFRPKTAEGIRILTGCQSIEELPDVLQHWDQFDHYGGNSILERLDPMDWVVKNPWKRLEFRVCLYFGRSYYNKKAKDLGIHEPKKFWVKEDSKNK